MMKWFRGLFGGTQPGCQPGDKIQIEVTLNVPAIHVFVHGPKEGEVADTSESGSMLQAREKRVAADNQATFAEDDTLAKLNSRLGKIETPKVQFGEETRTAP